MSKNNFSTSNIIFLLRYDITKDSLNSKSHSQPTSAILIHISMMTAL